MAQPKMQSNESSKEQVTPVNNSANMMTLRYKLVDLRTKNRDLRQKLDQTTRQLADSHAGNARLVKRIQTLTEKNNDEATDDDDETTSSSSCSDGPERVITGGSESLNDVAEPVNVQHFEQGLSKSVMQKFYCLLLLSSGGCLLL